jgi:hypothetical protein
MDIDFPLTRRPWMSKQSNFKSRPMNLPANSPVDAVVIGDGDPAARHAR